MSWVTWETTLIGPYGTARRHEAKIGGTWVTLVPWGSRWTVFTEYSIRNGSGVAHATRDTWQSARAVAVELFGGAR